MPWLVFLITLSPVTYTKNLYLYIHLYFRTRCYFTVSFHYTDISIYTQKKEYGLKKNKKIKKTQKTTNTKKNPKTHQHIQKQLAWIFQLYTQPIISVTIYRHYKNTHI